GSVPVGDTFWVKVAKDGYSESHPELVKAESMLPIHVAFKLAKSKRRAEGAQTAPLNITSNPTGATVLVSDAEFGRYTPWPVDEPVQVTPLHTTVDVGQALWMKLRKDGFETSAPEFVSIAGTDPVEVHAELKPLPRRSEAMQTQPAPVVAAAPQAEGGIVADGFAIIKQNAQEARNRAILDALGAAILEKYGADITARAVSSNFVLMESRVESLAQGHVAAYDVLEEAQEDGLYHVKVRVTFKEDLLKALKDQNVSVLVGGRETAVVAGGEVAPDAARQAVADVLAEAGMQVSMNEGDVAEAAQLAALARRQDLALFIGAACAERDRFGDFFSYKTDIDYALLTPESGRVVASGQVSGLNAKRELTAPGAASASLKDVGHTAGDQVLDTLVKRYDRSASHTIFIVGGIEPRLIEGLVAELRGIPGVKDARVCASEPGATEIELVMSPEARRDVPNTIQRLRNAELDFVEGNLHTTVARVR
ncbi:MAG: flagellar assembly protein T N-terminal domain-containing protein, partial [Candidatus Sumerlaeota bacterium]|nr:flagellar assembly protein T N-terminal domain-containing protein [Candidatus Sumerlaeota bacterium]